MKNTKHVLPGIASAIAHEKQIVQDTNRKPTQERPADIQEALFKIWFPRFRK